MLGKLKYYKAKLKERKHFKTLSKTIDLDRNVSFFFILSAGRSGSTLLRKQLMLETNVYIPPESEDMIVKLTEIWIDYQKKSYVEKINLIVGYLENRIYLKYWKIDFKELKALLLNIPLEKQKIDIIIQTIYLHQITKENLNHDKLLIGDKSPFLNFYLKYINLIFPHSKVIYLIRDPKAVISSYMTDRGYTFEKALSRWKSSVYTFLKHKHLFKNNIYILKYEDLIENPKTKIEEIINFLNATALKEKKLSIELGDTTLKHHKNIQNPINSDSLEKWKTNLTKYQIDKINSVFSKEMKQFKYE